MQVSHWPTVHLYIYYSLKTTIRNFKILIETKLLLLLVPTHPIILSIFPVTITKCFSMKASIFSNDV